MKQSRRVVLDPGQRLWPLQCG